MFNLFKKEPDLKATAIIMAAGEGTRMKSGVSKLLINLLDKPLIAYVLLAFQAVEAIENIIIVTKEQDILAMSDISAAFDISKVSSILTGGSTRQQSVMLGLAEAKNAEIVVIHDGARPCITPKQITQTIEAAAEFGAAAIGYKVNDTLKLVENGLIIKTVDRQNLWQVQTPQVFKTALIRNAHQTGEEQGIMVTDDTALLEALGIPVHMVEGSSANIKVTTNADIAIAESILGGREYNGY